MDGRYQLFENLSNEIVYEIFEYLDAYHVYQAFYNLNKRFRNILMLSSLPIKLNTSNISKSSFHNYYEQFIVPNENRVSSMYLSHPFIADLILPASENIVRFSQLKTLVIENIDSEYLENILEHLAALSKLSLLIINSVYNIHSKNIVYERIFRLPALKRCVLSLNDIGICYSLPQNVDLTHVNLKLQRITFDYFESSIMKFFHHLQVLRISTSNDIEYLNATRWEKVISSYMSQLRVFDIEHEHVLKNGTDINLYQNLTNQFTTSFWTKRKWFFGHQHSCLGHSNHVIFYSTHSYRRNYYKLRNVCNRYNYLRQTVYNLDVVRHVHIGQQSRLNYCSIYFPNATELAISDAAFDGSACSLLGNIVCLSKLTKIVIDYKITHFSETMQILNSAYNCQTLVIHFFSVDESQLSFTQTSETFRLLSSRNNIRNLTVKSLCTLQQVEFLVQLCPRLQHLDIHVSHEDFQSIIKYFLRNYEGIRNLLTLHIKSSEDIWIEKVINTIAEERQVDEISAKVIGYFQCYLWR
ncbi:unnamed protein product [Rotaria magnacalcarata]|uniref:F-box domain-containing protein n=1 Tax=Rotaria magnacalcarata TaxID=392030 RepID=A0A815KP33_9BILA|nr:unnamed protein product [Rotaria magnacalcarata]CAF1524657.1 unnamed protein product [Rotaria magnacalcarata]CAF3967936.1 unnamed protein product [Rotaria magnacalcarata]